MMATLAAHIVSRDQLPALLSLLGLNGQGAEIGVERGEYSEIILTNSRLAKLYSIDSWKTDLSGTYLDRNNLPQTTHEQNRQTTIERLARFQERSEIWTISSDAATAKFADGALDFIYIDANHSYPACAADLARWWPKSKPGGVFAGHDFIADGLYEQGEFGVKRAVTEFIERHRLPLALTQDLWPTWWLIKPGASNL